MQIRVNVNEKIQIIVVIFFPSVLQSEKPKERISGVNENSPSTGAGGGAISMNFKKEMVGAKGFEPSTPCSRKSFLRAAV